MAAAKRNIFVFMDNAPCDPESFIASYSNIKVIFYLKHYVKTATSRCRYNKKFQS